MATAARDWKQSLVMCPFRHHGWAAADGEKYEMEKRRNNLLVDPAMDACREEEAEDVSLASPRRFSLLQIVQIYKELAKMFLHD